MKVRPVCVPDGEVDIKGKGIMQTWYLVARRYAAKRCDVAAGRR